MTWTLDPAHSSVTFSVKHMMVTTVRGSLKIRDFALDFDPAAPAAGTVRVSLDADSIDTGQQSRDVHLRSADFLATEEHPAIDFVSTAIELEGDRWAIHGDLTIRGTTRPVALDAEYAGTVANMQGGRSAGFSATTTIDRDDFGLTWNVALEQGGWLVSREIKISIDLEVVAATDAEAETRAEDRERQRISA